MQNILKLLFCLLAFTLILGQFASLKSIFSVNVYLFDLFAVVYLVVGFLYLLRSTHKFVFPIYIVWHSIFLFFGMFALFFTQIPFSLVAIFYAGKFIVYLLCSVLTASLLNARVVTKGFLVDTLLDTGIIYCIIGFAQLLLLPDFEILDPSLGWDPHKFRLASTFFDPNFSGSFINICIFSLVFLYDRGLKMTRKHFVFLVIFFVSLVLTFSRSSWLMFAVGVFIFGLYKDKRILFVGAFICFLTYFAVPRIQTRISGATDPADSASLRLLSWKNSFYIANDNLPLGVGFNLYRNAQIYYGFLDYGDLASHAGAGADSSLLFVFATSGFLGLLSYVFGLASAVTKLSVLNISLVLGLLINSVFINSLFYTQIMFWLYTLLLIRDF